MQDEWLSLGDVAQVLGVHSSTVRNWSDHGQLPVHRTLGGHRRYLRHEIDLWVQTQRQGGADEANLIVQNALRATRFKISLGRLEQESWYVKLDDEAREQYRISGRAMMNGLINYLNFQGAKAEAEAESIGYEYASRGRRFGLNGVEATRAFLFFRNTLLDSMLIEYESAAVRSPHAWSNMFRKINEFTDTILITILETYETYHKNSR